MKLYLVTESNSRMPHVHTNLRAAKRQGSASVYTKGPDGNYYGYSNLTDLRRDEFGGYPYTIVSIVRPISSQTFLADKDQPLAWTAAVKFALGWGPQ